MYSIRWGAKSAVVTLYIRVPVSDTQISYWKLIFNIFFQSITLEERLDGCLLKSVHLCVHGCVCICFVYVVWMSLGALLAFPVSLALVQTNTQRLMVSLLVQHTHTSTSRHMLFKVLQLAAAMTLHSWSQVLHKWPKHWAWLRHFVLKLQQRPTWDWHHRGNTPDSSLGKSHLNRCETTQSVVPIYHSHTTFKTRMQILIISHLLLWSGGRRSPSFQAELKHRNWFSP